MKGGEETEKGSAVGDKEEEGEGGAEGKVEDKEETEGEAEGVELAKQHFKKGVEFFKSESYEAALVEFLESYRINSKWAVKYNIAVCYLKNNKYVSSLKYFKEYLAEGGEKISEERKAKVLHDISKLEETVGRVVFCCDLEGSRLILNDVETYEEIPPEGMLFDPGIHKVEISKEGHKPFIKQLNVVAGAEMEVEVKLEPTGDGKKPKRAKLPKSVVWLVSGLAAGGALGIGAVTTGALVLSSRDRMDQEAHKCASTATREDCPAAYKYFDRAKDLRIAANVLAGAALAVGVTGVVMFFIMRRKEKESTAKEKIKVGFIFLPDRLTAASFQVNF